MQRDFLASGQPEARDRFVRAKQDLVTLARSRGWPVLWVRQEIAPDLAGAPLDVRRGKKAVVVRGTPGAELCNGLESAPGEPTRPAFQRDLAVAIARECVGSWDPEQHDVSLRDLHGRRERVLTTRDIAREL